MRGEPVLEKLNSLTKYPSIPTYHTMGDRGRLSEDVQVRFDPEERWTATEKIDGTNARIILAPEGWYLGSREELLTFEDDRIRNPALGIVATLMPLLCELRLEDPGVVVLWGEVYGAKIGKAGNDYSTTKTAFRLFDVAAWELDAFTWDAGQSVEEIAHWREAGKQPFLGPAEQQQWARRLGFEQAPALLEGLGSGLPTTVSAMAEWLQRVVPPVSAAVLHGGSAKPEGLVLRNASRTKICKLRVEDYARTMRK